MSGVGETAGWLAMARRAWDRFWFAEGSTMSLGVFRVLFAYCMWREVATTRAKSVFAIEGGFHLPYLEWIPLVSEVTYQRIHELEYPLIVLFGLGVLARPAGAILLFLQGWMFFADQLNFRNHPYAFLLVLLALLLSPCDDALSVRSLVRAWWGDRSWRSVLLGSRRPLTFQRLIQVQLALVYVYAGLHKLNPGFLDGQVLSGLMRRVPWIAEVRFGRWLTPESIEAMRDFVAETDYWVVPSYLTAGLEVSLPFLLFYRRTRPFALLVGIGFHLTIAVTMNIFTFSLGMISSYVLFLDPETLPRLARRLVGSPARAPAGALPDG